MQPTRPRPWPSRVGIGLLVLASPLLLAVAWFVLVDWPWDVGIGVVAAFSDHDVIQTADAEETGVSLLLLGIVVWAACWVMHLRLPGRFALPAAIYGLLLCVPLIALLGLGSEYVLQGLLASRGYQYCTYHVISTDKGGNGTYVYANDSVPGSCAAAKVIFPPGMAVPGHRAPFDLPPSLLPRQSG
jgi:hypothetical protein